MTTEICTTLHYRLCSKNTCLNWFQERQAIASTVVWTYTKTFIFVFCALTYSRDGRMYGQLISVYTSRMTRRSIIWWRRYQTLGQVSWADRKWPTGSQLSSLMAQVKLRYYRHIHLEIKPSGDMRHFPDNPRRFIFPKYYLYWHNDPYMRS